MRADWLARLSLRTRVAVLSALVMTVAVALLAAVVLSVFSAGLRQGTDQLLAADTETLKTVLVLKDDGGVEFFSLGDGVPDELAGNLRFQVRDVDGQVLLSSPGLVGVSLPLSIPEPLTADYARLHDVPLGNELIRVREQALVLRGGGDTERTLVLQAARSIQPFVSQERRLRALLLSLLPLPILFVAIGSAFVAGRGLAPLREMMKTVQEMGAEDLDRRVPVQRQDEVGELAGTFNLMLERLDRSFQSLRRFTADASHELRTPLTALRAQAEVALGRARDAAEYRDVLGSMLEELQRLEQMVDRLLQLARGDAGIATIDAVDMDLAKHAREWVERYSVLAEEKQIAFDLALPERAPIRADRAVLDHALANLLDNAIAVSPAGSRIALALHDEGARLSLRICDQGPGIPPSEREHVFARFARLPGGRTRADGVGLGLAMVQWAVRLHGGCVRVEDHRGVGACFVVTLPRAS